MLLVNAKMVRPLHLIPFGGFSQYKQLNSKQCDYRNRKKKASPIFVVFSQMLIVAIDINAQIYIIKVTTV